MHFGRNYKSSDSKTILEKLQLINKKNIFSFIIKNILLLLGGYIRLS